MNRPKNPNIWGPPFWFTLHTICQHYPTYPNSVIKKKYYDFLSNIPLFLPHEQIGDKFAELLDKYPLNPYLESQPKLCKWMHFIHNKINLFLGKPTLSMTDSMTAYYQHYKPKAVKDRDEMKIREKIIFFSILCILFALVIALYSTPLNF